jgi:hypothetical protein
MKIRYNSLSYAAALALLIVPGHAAAEGSAQIGVAQRLQSATAGLAVDIVDHTAETIRWQGNGELSVRNPSGTLVGTLSNNEVYDPSVNGRFTLSVGSNQTGAWDVAVLGQTAAGGRLSATNWQLDANGFAVGQATSASYYAVVPGGSPSNTGVVELKLNGLAGYLYAVGANSTGVNGSNAGRSVVHTSNSFTPALRMYLAAPTDSTYSPLTPTVGALAFQAGAQSCNYIVPGVTTGTFRFTTDVAGTYHLVCDLDRNGVYDRSAAADYLKVGPTVSGLNEASWDGRNNAGMTVPSGSYDCRVFVNVGELHFVVDDIETSYQGLRLFGVPSVDATSAQKTSLAMFWNDSLVLPPSGNDIDLPSGAESLHVSGASGMASGAYTDAAVANTNARAWGNFNASGSTFGDGKGNDRYLDTFASLISISSAVAQLTATTLVADGDGDLISTYTEACVFGTNPASVDSDGDTVSDYVETGNGTSAINTDGLEGIDALDTDSDNDGVADDTDTARRFAESCRDVDADGCNDCVNTRADGSGGSTTNDGPDFDADGACNAGDTDDDNDGVLDAADSNDFNSNICRDVDGDNCNDCSLTGANNSGGSTTNDGDDFDGDTLCNAGDPDDDNDGVPTVSDSNDRNPFMCRDLDGDSCNDCSITGANNSGGDVANDGWDYDGDTLCDIGDQDDDADGVSDFFDPMDNNEHVCRDVDGDGCDDCTNTGDDGSGGSTTNDGHDYDGDTDCDAGDTDDDNDGVLDPADGDDNDENVCRDVDSDACDDCTNTGANNSGGNTTNDGADYDGDTDCDAGDDDDDNDGVPDGDDDDDFDDNECNDSDGDGCDDCINGGSDPGDDGVDFDGDDLCDAGDPDDDDDGVDDDTDSSDFDANVCRDLDADSCDDCTHTGNDGSGGDVFSDGPDADSDGECDATDDDFDNDGVDDDGDDDSLDPNVCRDLDGDSCDDCALSGADRSGGNTSEDGPDLDGDGACDAEDEDQDNDGVDDDDDSAERDASVCRDTDGDGCDDCANTGADLSGGDVADDGLDLDDDGLCDAGDDDDDGDGVQDGEDDDALDPNVCADTDGDGCDDCTVTGADGSGGDIDDDGADADGDGICDAGAPGADKDGDGIEDEADLDADNDGIPNDADGDGDQDGDGIENWLDLDSDGDGLADIVEAGGVDTNGDALVDDFDDDDAAQGANGLHDGFERPGTALPLPDTDDDALRDYLDLDSDGDGISDVIEADGRALDQGGDGRVDDADDEDENGRADVVDSAALVPPDSDDDGDFDFRDLDSDDDSVVDAIEGHDVNSDGAPDIAPATGDEADENGDGLNDAYASGAAVPNHDMDQRADYRDPDDDADGTPTADEVADALAFPELGDDVDGDGALNYLDVDSDGDDVSDIAEQAADGDINDDEVPDYIQPWVQERDSDRDGLLDHEERDEDGGELDTDGDGVPNAMDDDDDGDGVPTSDERAGGTHDTDGDGEPDHLDPDDDGDGIPTESELDEDDTVRDTDGDGKPDHLDVDDDDDGIPTSIERGGEELDDDIDGDGIPNHRDLDSDGDGLLDEAEADADLDRNGIPDYREPPHAAFAGGALCSIGSAPAGRTNASFLGLLMSAIFGIFASRRRRTRN